jgi:hypothetical protein
MHRESATGGIDGGGDAAESAAGAESTVRPVSV